MLTYSQARMYCRCLHKHTQCTATHRSYSKRLQRVFDLRRLLNEVSECRHAEGTEDIAQPLISSPWNPNQQEAYHIKELKSWVGKEGLSRTFIYLMLSYIWCLYTRTYTGEASMAAETHTSWCCVRAGGLWAGWRGDLGCGFLCDWFRGPDLWIWGVQSFQPFCVLGATVMGRSLHLCARQQTRRY